MKPDAHQGFTNDATATRSAGFQPAGATAAFTLLEILLVLAIAGMMTAVIAVGYTRMASRKPATPDAVFWLAVTAARKQALMSGREVRLAYTPAATTDGADTPAGLDLTWDTGPTTWSGTTNPAGDTGDDTDAPATGEQFFPFEKMGDIICEFLSTQKGTQSITIGGQAVETQTIPTMTFYGDGTCTPVRIQFRRNGGAAYTLDIDPWTCAQMLTSDTTAQ